MDIVGIDIAEAEFDAALPIGRRVGHAASSDTQAGFERFSAWLGRHRPDPATPVHARMGETLVPPEQASGERGLEPAAFPHGSGVRVGVVDPARVEAYGESEPSRDETDRLDAAPIARFRRARVPPARAPPTRAGRANSSAAATPRRPRGCGGRTARMNAEGRSWLRPAGRGGFHRRPPRPVGRADRGGDGQIGRPIASDPAPRRNFAPPRGIGGFGRVSAAIPPAEPPDIAEFTPKAPAAFAGRPPSRLTLSPREHGSASSVRGPGEIGRVGGRRPRGALDMCALGAERTDEAPADFVRRMTAAGKPPEVVPVAVAREPPVYAHAVIRARKPFTSSPDAPAPARRATRYLRGIAGGDG